MGMIGLGRGLGRCTETEIVTESTRGRRRDGTGRRSGKGQGQGRRRGAGKGIEQGRETGTGNANGRERGRGKERGSWSGARTGSIGRETLTKTLTAEPGTGGLGRAQGREVWPGGKEGHALLSLGDERRGLARPCVRGVGPCHLLEDTAGSRCLVQTPQIHNLWRFCRAQQWLEQGRGRWIERACKGRGMLQTKRGVTKAPDLDGRPDLEVQGPAIPRLLASWVIPTQCRFRGL